MLLFLLLLFNHCARAQGDTLSTVNDSLHYKNSILRVYPVIYNNGTRLYRGQAERFFSKVPKAEVLYAKYRRQYKSGLYSFGGFFAGMGASAIAINNGNRRLAGGGVVLGLGFFVRSVVLFAKGEATLRSAITTYNGK